MEEEKNSRATPVAKDENHEMLCTLSAEERERLKLLQQLLATAGQPNQMKRQQAVGQKLGISDRSVRRLLL